MTIGNTLDDRSGKYGSFKEASHTTQRLKEVMAKTPNWLQLEPYMREALDMIVLKIGRILNGDPWYPDSWHDIAGYTALVERLINEHQP